MSFKFLSDKIEARSVHIAVTTFNVQTLAGTVLGLDSGSTTVALPQIGVLADTHSLSLDNSILLCSTGVCTSAVGLWEPQA